MLRDVHIVEGGSVEKRARESLLFVFVSTTRGTNDARDEDLSAMRANED